ncbi:hypothetical protein [Kitasatospora sp. NPDC057541]|uniref:hypothetical protein n=1 Tax=unclassified Kitasatospora TaxID=2633591 RepID=UPI0036A49A68
MLKKRIVQVVAATAAVAAFGLFSASSASAANATCESWGGICTSASIGSNSNHEVCFSGTHKALSYWGRAELWDADTGVLVGSFPTNPTETKSKCVGGLYGSHYYERGTGGYFKGMVWN